MKQLTVLTGAGISAESGVQTFRGQNGLWEGYDINEVATPEAFYNDPEKVLNFYNLRRQQVRKVKPNPAHFALVELEKHFDVQIVTQNIDDLHERAGSSNVLHLHGEILKVCSSNNPQIGFDKEGDIELGDTCPEGYQLRPFVVWFGESVPSLIPAAEIVASSDVLLIIGTSLVVYPAAMLSAYSPSGTPVYYIDPEPVTTPELNDKSKLRIIEKTATAGIRTIKDELIKIA